ncbi:MAG: ATP-dependent DNA helicase RecG [Campylobacterota bacterium]
MPIEQKDLDKFKRLGIQSITALATLAPTAFEDKRINTQMQVEKMQVIDATVEQISRSPKRTLITLFAHNFNHRIEAVLFNPKPYLLRHFVIGEQSFFYGKISCNSGHCQMTHPLKIDQVGTIVPKYKTALRADVMRRLVERYINSDNLRAEGLPDAVIKLLLTVHFPTPEQGDRLSLHQTQALKFAELYDYMKVLGNKRRYFPSLYRLTGKWKEWAEALPFTLTGEQTAAIEAIEDDLQKDVSAKRMVVGDVGSGKTMVILASALIAQPHRAVLMAPTTILANQLFEEAQKYLPHLKSVLVQNSTKKSLDLEQYDFIIGTHALLYRELPDSGLIMIDEQHRFGTAQRKLLENIISTQEKRPHFLQFSATPIPRTQAMIDSAHIDVSLITQTPFTKDIKTSVIHKNDFAGLLEKISDELEKKHQVLIIYPLVEQSDALAYQSIEEARGYWERRFSDVYVTHGKDKNKETILEQFRERGSILLATTVVEVGISLPRLTTIIIVGAERLGLSTLHQLRGRVSRNGLKGYCYLYTNKTKSERLDAFVKTDNGFDIAALDLKFRKGGDLLVGKTQSGDKFRWIDMGEDEAIVKKVKEQLSK